MKILMDLLAIQSEGSKGRGIGRYSQELSKQIVKNLNEVDITLNSLYPEELLLYPNAKQYTILDTEKKSFEEKSKYNKLNTILLKKQLTKDKDVDIIHFHSVFEGLVGKADILNDFSNIPKKKVITLYDLIPLIYKDIYLDNKDVRKWYFNKLRLIYEADLLLAISDATKEDAINILGIPQNKIINISGAIDKEKFYKMDKIALEQNRSILNKYGITQSYIMYTGGIDFRKNIESSIEAFAKIDKENIAKYQYVIVCKITKEQIEEFEHIIKRFKIPKNKIIFTGFVTDQELNFLYNASTLFIFPSLYEGFGLPVLEAMTCATVVIGSNCSSVPEIISRDDCMFDPSNIADITKTINYILNNEELRENLEDYFYNRSKQFSWEKSAATTIEAYKQLCKKKTSPVKRIKIAFFSPLPNQRSGISDYSLELLPFLSKYMDIDIFVDDYEVQDDYLNSNFNIFNYKEFETKKEQYENIIYQFGNSQYHEYMYNIALNNSGIIVLHDFFLSGLVRYIEHKQNDSLFFFDNLIYSHGRKGEEYVDKIISRQLDVEEVVRTLPINKKVLDSAKAIIVHSTYAKELFSKYYSNSYNIYKINQLIKTPSIKTVDERTKQKEVLGFKEEDIVIGAFGHITDTKQYDFILELFKEEDIFKNENIKLIFIGDFISNDYKIKINNMIKKYKFKKVKITGFVSDDEYKKYLLASDIGINLRVDSRGETSRALLMNMAFGLPTIINDYASFSELPNDAVSKVVLNSKEDFITKIKLLIEQKNIREQLGKNAYKYIQTNHNIEEISKEYYDCCFDMKKEIQTTTNTVDEIANTIVEYKLDGLLSHEEYIKIATILKNNSQNE